MSKRKPTRRPYTVRPTPIKTTSALLGITQREFARQSGINYQTVGRIYNGRRAPTPAFTEAAERILGMPADEIRVPR